MQIVHQKFHKHIQDFLSFSFLNPENGSCLSGLAPEVLAKVRLSRIWTWTDEKLECGLPRNQFMKWGLLRTYCIFSTVFSAGSQYPGAHHLGQKEGNQSRNRALVTAAWCSLYDLEEPFISRFSDVTVLLFFFFSFFHLSTLFHQEFGRTCNKSSKIKWQNRERS